MNNIYIYTHAIYLISSIIYICTVCICKRIYIDIHKTHKKTHLALSQKVFESDVSDRKAFLPSASALPAMTFRWVGFFRPESPDVGWLKLGETPQESPGISPFFWRPGISLCFFFLVCCFFGSAVWVFFRTPMKEISLSLSLFLAVYVYICIYLYIFFFLPRVFWYCWRWNTGIPQYPRWFSNPQSGRSSTPKWETPFLFDSIGKDASFYSQFIYQLHVG